MARVLALSAVACLGAGLMLGGCQSTGSGTRFSWKVPPDQMAAFARDRNACLVEVEKVMAPYLAVDKAVFADEAGNRTLVACMRGKGYVLARTETF